MPLTLTIQDDVAALLEAEAVQRQQSVPVVAMSLLRRALAANTAPESRPTSVGEPFRIQPHLGGFAFGVNPAKLTQLADELDLEVDLLK